MGETEHRILFGFILEEDLATGFLLAALGQCNPETKQPNYFIVNEDTPYKSLKEKFLRLYLRKDIALLLISSDVEKKLSHYLTRATRPFPILLTVPTKKEAMQKVEATSRRKTEMLADVVAWFAER